MTPTDSARGLPRDEGSMYDRDLDPGPANYTPLTPLVFLPRAAQIYPTKAAVVHGERVLSYGEVDRRVRRLAHALVNRGIRRGDTVSIMAPNVPALLEAHFGVPLAGAVLNPINTRLDPGTVAFILRHSNSRLVVVDRELRPVVEEARRRLDQPPGLVEIKDQGDDGGHPEADCGYEALLREGREDFPGVALTDEWQAICLSYTSGTTGDPKGVVYHHRGAHLAALGNALTFGVDSHSVYLWTLPMFHCSGWTYTWGATAAMASHICLRRCEPGRVFDLIARHRVSHFCAAPVVLNMLVNAPPEVQRRYDQPVVVATGGSAPPSAVIEKMEALGIKVIHLYGLTETYGPSVFCAPQAAWAALPLEQRAAKMARQGMPYPTIDQLAILDPETLDPVPADGVTVGELMLRGNTVMKGYLKNPIATERAFAGGWFHSGDLGVMHPDGYVEVKDRAKDIIISGGENISSLEVEEVLYRHPGILEAAAVAALDPNWGEVPWVYVVAKAEVSLTEDEVQDFCRHHLAKYKIPKRVVFIDELPKTATGKIQKNVLRGWCRTTQQASIPTAAD
ncbi:MAG: long-chain-fatty-acid--CoA ligase [Candidatus Competibacterales bacterium]